MTINAIKKTSTIPSNIMLDPRCSDGYVPGSPECHELGLKDTFVIPDRG
jgi:hypothetical protein